MSYTPGQIGARYFMLCMIPVLVIVIIVNIRNLSPMIIPIILISVGIVISAVFYYKSMH